MRKLSLSLAAAAIALSFGAFFAPAEKAEAAVIYPWCAHYGGGRFGGSSVNCGFLTWAQCMATVSGSQGFCDGNPWWQGPVPQAAAKPQYLKPRV
ncbi:MAG TPA: DUF3551 domain-containing protein [Xanthobacteraceae bacterium]|nr:DUF3551 domain-containing protein [Xanthobacteraceae bacterium]